MIYHSIQLNNSQGIEPLRQQIATQDQAVLLDSPEFNDQHRFSYFAFEPEKLLMVNNNNYQTEGFDLPKDHQQNPFEAIEYLLSLYPRPTMEEKFKFEGGIMGYFGYHLLNERPNNYQRDDLSLPELWLGYFPIVMVLEHQSKRIHIAGLPHQQAKANKLKAWLNSALSATQEAMPLTPFRTKDNWHSNMSQKEYVTKFNKVQHYLQQGDCYQINLAQRWNITFEGSNWTAYQQLYKLNKAPYSAFINLSHTQQILSFSPEQFIQCQLLNNQLKCQTRPIKGTRPRHQQLESDNLLLIELASSSKDQAENVMIVDLLRNDFSKICQPHSVEVTELFGIESYPAVHHLVSTVVGVLEPNKSAVDLIQACFPGGSITGAPKIRAMEIIEELEPNGRSVYCGSIGYISATGTMDTNIAIRTLVADNHQLYCWAGGGIVADSQAESEYCETLDKVSTILPVIKNMEI